MLVGQTKLQWVDTYSYKIQFRKIWPFLGTEATIAQPTPSSSRMAG